MSARSPLLRQLTVLALLITGIAASMQMVEAQSAPETEKLSLPPGSVFEVLAQEGAPQTRYAWVLSLERTFLQAGRGRAFRTRFTQAGRYLLSAEVVAPAGKAIRRSFAITVGGEPETPSASETVPPNLNGAMVLGAEQRLIRIRPTAEMLQDITLDADLSVDENGDGNAENDPSAAGTFLVSESLPIYLWITKNPPVSFAIAGTQSDGTPLLRQFTASLVTTPASSPEPATDGIAIMEERDGSLRFRINDLPPMQTPVLPIWDFGDGTQSMVMEPVHKFASSGTYVVRVRLKDLRNGISVRDLMQTVTVKAPEAPSPTEKPKPVPKKPAPEGTPSDGSSLVSFIVKILIGLMIAAAIGGSITVVIVKLRKGKSLAEHLEETDKKMAISKEAAASTAATPTPMSLPTGQAGLPTRQIGLPEVIDEEPPPPAPPVPAGPVPSWLRDSPKAPKAAPPPPPPAQIPAPTPTLPTSVPTPPPTPSPASARTPVPFLTDAAMPDWLTPNAEKKSALPVTPSSMTVPSPTPAPVKESVNPPKIETPPWLQPHATNATPATSSTHAPTPVANLPSPNVLSDKERERRRLKRQRYRQNKQRREEASASGIPPTNVPDLKVAASETMQDPPDDAPVAFIRAESIENTPNPNPNPNPNPDSNPASNNPQ